MGSEGQREVLGGLPFVAHTLLFKTELEKIIRAGWDRDREARDGRRIALKKE